MKNTPKLNKKALSRAIDIETKHCENCSVIKPKSELIDLNVDMWRYTNTPTEKLYCNDCYEYEADRQAD